ncbi:DUF3048 domain-containing protein [Streptomyces sp. NPDC005438]|uniref:DUF3048 domain-containing protein n=1 Tax=Streptomyces sp. NPDC005438 TaxID=3156880 RepID=UPI0033AEC7DD
MFGNHTSPTDETANSGKGPSRRGVLAAAAAGVLTVGVAVKSSALEGPKPPGTKAKEETSPFTGLPAEPGPVMVVKIDNHKDARPHTGLEIADIVVVEQVEGGLGRLIGVFASKMPETLGPVRSAREYNVEQLRMFDAPVLAYSGAKESVVELIDKSPIFGLSNDNFPSAFRREESRPAPHNLYVDPQKILAEAPEASVSKDIGLAFGDRPEGGKATEQFSVKYPAFEASFEWSAEEERWLASFDGEPAMNTDGKQLGGTTVVVQKVDMPHNTPDDPTPYIKTVGKGEATVLRNGEAFTTTWERKSETDGTTYTLENGEKMPFDPGQTWLVYEER